MTRAQADTRTTGGQPLTRPLLVFDGDCGFCTTSVNWAARHFRQPVDVEPWQRLDLDALGLTARDVERYAWWIEPAGESGNDELRKWRGHRAAGRVLRSFGGLWPWAGALLLAPPPFSWLWATGYRLVSTFRGYLPGGTPACRLPPAKRPTEDP